MDSAFQPKLATTAIGSLPFADGEEAASFALSAGLSIPFWPQTPKRSFLDGMIPQYSEGLPCTRVDRQLERIQFDAADKFAQLEGFYEKFLQEDPALFAISEEAAGGLYAFERLAGGRAWPYVKGHITGPITFTTGVYNAEREPIYSDPDLRDAAVKTLVRKAEWQVARLRRFGTEGVIIFVDEPALAAYGSSAYIYLSEEKVCALLGDVFSAISAAGAIPGVHVCGNSDWSMLVRSGVQILNFDAYRYGESISLYPEEIGRFLEDGGSIAWGIVPTTDAVRQETVDHLAELLQTCFDSLARKGIDRELVRRQSILTPSCGAGSLTVEEAGEVFRLLSEVQRRILAEAS